MTACADLLKAIDELRAHATQFIDESFRLTLEGDALSEAAQTGLRQISELASCLDIEPPTFRISDTNVSTDDLVESDFGGEPWRLIFGKTALAGLLCAREDETTLLFFSMEGFHQWLSSLDPFLYPTGNAPDLARPTTIRVSGLDTGFGGPLLWVLPLDGQPPEPEIVALPDSAEVHGLIHTHAVRPLRVYPQAYALTWGDLNTTDAAPLVRLSARVLAACLVQELKYTDDGYEVTLRGTKRLSVPLFDNEHTVTFEALKNLQETVRWVYEERSETRLRLVMDRLSIDIEHGQSMLSGASKYLKSALQQARDSYTFVILERKDAYHKEVRELMKDMKSQADLYAAKVRDLTSSITRDILGVLVFIGFSFIGKFDQTKLQELLDSAELALLVKFLAGYLMLSCVLLLSSHLYDASLAYKESKIWLDVLQHYSSQSDKQDRFLGPIACRRSMLFKAVWIVGFIYIGLAVMMWNLPSIIECLLHK